MEIILALLALGLSALNTYWIWSDRKESIRIRFPSEMRFVVVIHNCGRRGAELEWVALETLESGEWKPSEYFPLTEKFIPCDRSVTLVHNPRSWLELAVSKKVRVTVALTSGRRFSEPYRVTSADS